MNIQRFIQKAPDEFYAWGSLTAYPRDALRYVEVLDRVQGMTTPSTMHLLNYAVQCMDEGECYLEVGTWRGATLIGALLGNKAHGYAIDNGSMTEHNGDERSSQEVWAENIEQFGMTNRAAYINGSVPQAFEQLIISHDPLTLPQIGVYFFDGDKSTTEAAYQGLVGVVPFLADHALLICDDANTTQIREATYWFCHQYRDKALKVLDLPTPGNTWPSFWNGLIVIAWGVSMEG